MIENLDVNDYIHNFDMIHLVKKKSSILRCLLLWPMSYLIKKKKGDNKDESSYNANQHQQQEQPLSVPK